MTQQKVWGRHLSNSNGWVMSGEWMDEGMGSKGYGKNQRTSIDKVLHYNCHYSQHVISKEFLGAVQI